MKINIWYFSGTGQTKTLAKQTAAYYKEDRVELRDITGYEERLTLNKGIEADQLILLFPIYGSEAPKALRDTFRKFAGKGVPVMLIALWGKCHKAGALYHMAEIMEESGFIVNGGAEIEATHSYLASTYPIPLRLNESEAYFRYLDERLGKKEKVHFASQKRGLAEGVMCSLPEGTFPRIATKISFHKEMCTQCQVCIKCCPNKAIGTDYQIDEKHCSRCLSCVTKCPQKAREITVKKIAKKLLSAHGNQGEKNRYYY